MGRIKFGMGVAGALIVVFGVVAHFLTGLAGQYMEGVQGGLCSAS